MEEKKHEISIVNDMMVETEVLDQPSEDERAKAMEAFSARYQSTSLSGIRLNEEYIATQIRLRGLSIDDNEDDGSAEQPYNPNIVRRWEE